MIFNVISHNTPSVRPCLSVAITFDAKWVHLIRHAPPAARCVHKVGNSGEWEVRSGECQEGVSPTCSQSVTNARLMLRLASGARLDRNGIMEDRRRGQLGGARPDTKPRSKRPEFEPDVKTDPVAGRHKDHCSPHRRRIGCDSSVSFGGSSPYKRYLCVARDTWR